MTGEVDFDAGDLEKAEAWFDRSLRICEEAADKRGEANARRWLGKCALRRGRNEDARDGLDAALRAYVSFEMWEELLGCLEDIAEGRHRADAARSTRLIAAVDAARTRLQLPRAQKDDTAVRALSDAMRDELGAEAFEAQWREGSSLDIRDAIAQAQAPADVPAPDPDSTARA
jgi:hypothetical protein